MCLGIPGKVLSIEAQPGELATGKVDFSGVIKKVCLAYTPQAEVGDYVVVHVGFAISRLDEAEALKVFSYLDQMGELQELESP